MNIGVIGLGLMGTPMSKNILKQFPLFIYNRTKSRTEELASLGATVCDSPKDLASKIDVLITLVTAGKDVEEVLFGDNGVIQGAQKNLIIIDMSTIGPSSAKSLNEKLKTKNIQFLDAPVTGGTPKAESGELTIFVGGEKEILEKVRSVLETLGKTIIYMGKSGNGQAIKLINNYLIAAGALAAAESMILADSLGLPRELVLSPLSQTPNISPSLALKMKNFVTDTHPTSFSLANMRKDVGLAKEEMEKAGLHLKLLTQLESIYAQANDDEEQSKQDFSVIINELQK